MAGCTLYGASIHHPRFAELSPTTKWTFVELAVDYMDANNLDLPDGFIHSDLLFHCSMGKEAALKALDELQKAGIVEPYVDPDGWLIVNFTKRAERFRPTAKETKLPNWGQRSLAEIEKRRHKHAEFSAKSRGRYKEKIVDQDSPIDSQSLEPPF